MSAHTHTHRGQKIPNIPFWKWWIESNVIMRLILPDISFEDCLHVLFNFLQKAAAPEIALIPTKHLCHIINTSQSCLSTRKDGCSSVLIFVFYSVFVLCREKSYSFILGFFFSLQGCSALLINTGVLFSSSFGLYWFWGLTHYSNCSSVPFHLFISFSSHQQRLWTWHDLCFTIMGAHNSTACYLPLNTGDYAPSTFWNLNVISKLSPWLRPKLLLCS